MTLAKAQPNPKVAVLNGAEQSDLGSMDYKCPSTGGRHVLDNVSSNVLPYDTYPKSHHDGQMYHFICDACHILVILSLVGGYEWSLSTTKKYTILEGGKNDNA